MEGSRKFLISKTNGPPHINSSNIQDFFNSIYLFIVQKFDEILPIETRSQTLHNWAHTFLFVILPVTLLLLCLYRCCCGEIKLGSCLRRCFCCCCCCSRNERTDDFDDDFLEPHRYEAMMRAPGRYGHFMPRNSFERDPRSYFKDLRASKGLYY